MSFYISDKNNLYSVGFGETYALGHNNDTTTLNDFKIINFGTMADINSSQITEKIEKE